MDFELQIKLDELFENLSFSLFDGDFDDIPYPYGVFASTETNMLFTKTTYGNSVYIQIDLFSDYNGQKEVKEMSHEIINICKNEFYLNDLRKVILDNWAFSTNRTEEFYQGILQLTFSIY